MCASSRLVRRRVEPRVVTPIGCAGRHGGSPINPDHDDALRSGRRLVSDRRSGRVGARAAATPRRGARRGPQESPAIPEKAHRRLIGGAAVSHRRGPGGRLAARAFARADSDPTPAVTVGADGRFPGAGRLRWSGVQGDQRRVRRSGDHLRGAAGRRLSAFGSGWGGPACDGGDRRPVAAQGEPSTPGRRTHHPPGVQAHPAPRPRAPLAVAQGHRQGWWGRGR
jgi:hypothetical protein